MIVAAQREGKNISAAGGDQDSRLSSRPRTHSLELAQGDARQEAMFMPMGVPDAITGVMACSTVGLAASLIVILRVPVFRASVLPCVLLLMLPAGLLLWSMYARVTGFSAAGRALVCTLPVGGISVYMRTLLRQGHHFGVPAVVCPGRQVRRWICCAIGSCSLAIGWAPGFAAVVIILGILSFFHLL